MTFYYLHGKMQTENMHDTNTTFDVYSALYSDCAIVPDLTNNKEDSGKGHL
jgi:hypothetical protein